MNFATKNQSNDVTIEITPLIDIVFLLTSKIDTNQRLILICLQNIMVKISDLLASGISEALIITLLVCWLLFLDLFFINISQLESKLPTYVKYAK